METDRDPGTARHTEAGMVRLGRMQTRAWSPGRRKQGEGRRRENQDRGTDRRRDPSCAGHGRGQAGRDGRRKQEKEGEGRRREEKGEPGAAGLVEAGMGPSMADADARQPRVEGRRRRRRRRRET